MHEISKANFHMLKFFENFEAQKRIKKLGNMC